jgi:hypothetical protein
MSKMRATVQLFIAVVKGTLIIFVGCVTLLLGAYRLGLNVDRKSTAVDVLILLIILSPNAVGDVWMFRKLPTIQPRREARALSIAFSLCTPVFLGVSMFFGEISGSYSEALGGRPIFGPIGAFGGAFVFTAFMSFLVCALVLRVTKLSIDVEGTTD